MKGSGEKGFTLWFTGLPCSGKTTVSDIVEKELRERAVVLSPSQNVRPMVAGSLHGSRVHELCLGISEDDK